MLTSRASSLWILTPKRLSRDALYSSQTKKGCVSPRINVLPVRAKPFSKLACYSNYQKAPSLPIGLLLTSVKRCSLSTKATSETEKTEATEFNASESSEEKKTSDYKDIDWLEVLENSANAPWLALEHTPSDKATMEDRLKRAYSRIFQIILYLGRPQEDAEQFLTYFEKNSAEEGSELARARNAVTILTRTVVRDIASIPQSSPLRTNHPLMFDVFGALLPLHDMYIQAGSAPDVPTWTEFWSRAQPILLTLGMKLDEDGYGLTKDKK